MSKTVHAGFLINCPAHGKRGAREALRRQPNWFAQRIPEFAAEAALALSPDSLLYFGPSPEIVCADGTRVIVHILGVPATTTALLDPSHKRYEQMNERLLDSCKRLLKLSGEDIKVLGLGAATAIAGNHGYDIFEANQRLVRPIPLITNGNTITAGLSVQIAWDANSRWTGITPQTIGVVGGFGSVGSRVVSMAAELFQAHQVIIATHNANEANQRRLEKLREGHPKTKFVVGTLQEAMSCRLSFLATSDAEPLPIDPSWLPKPAVVIDIGKPLNTSPELAKSCPRVFIADGSLAELPEGTNWSSHCARMALPRNGVFGCLAETITLARLYANGELAEHVGKQTFIGRPDDEMAKKMVRQAGQTGLRPLVLPAHRRD